MQLPLAVLENEHSDWVRYVGFSEIGRESGNGDAAVSMLQLISGSDDGQLISWNARSAEKTHTLHMRSNHRLHAATQLYHGSLFIYGDDEEVFFVDNEALTPVGQFSPHNGSVTALALTDDEEILVSSGEDESVVVSRLVRGVRKSSNGGVAFDEHFVEATSLAVCSSFVTQRRCISFMTCVTSIAILAGQPSSTTLVIVATASDGTFVHWVVDTRHDLGEEGEEEPTSQSIGYDAATGSSSRQIHDDNKTNPNNNNNTLLKTCGGGTPPPNSSNEDRNISVRKYEWGIGPLTTCCVAK